jgi:excisionase family DNA binding protein
MALLSVKQAAERAGVSVALVYGWCQAGVLSHHRLGQPGKRGCIRIAEADLDGFFASRKREGRQETPPPAPRRAPTRLKHLHLPS